jgi:hypothetical protein
MYSSSPQIASFSGSRHSVFALLPYATLHALAKECTQSHLVEIGSSEFASQGGISDNLVRNIYWYQCSSVRPIPAFEPHTIHSHLDVLYLLQQKQHRDICKDELVSFMLAGTYSNKARLPRLTNTQSCCTFLRHKHYGNLKRKVGKWAPATRPVYWACSWSQWPGTMLTMADYHVLAQWYQCSGSSPDP